MGIEMEGYVFVYVCACVCLWMGVLEVVPLTNWRVLVNFDPRECTHWAGLMHADFRSQCVQLPLCASPIVWSSHCVQYVYLG